MIEPASTDCIASRFNAAAKNPLVLNFEFTLVLLTRIRRQRRRALIIMACEADRASRLGDLHQRRRRRRVGVVHIVAGRTLDLPTVEHHRRDGSRPGLDPGTDRHRLGAGIEQRPIPRGKRSVVGKARWMVHVEISAELVRVADKSHAGLDAEAIQRDRAVMAGQAKLRRGRWLPHGGLEGGTRIQRIYLGRHRMVPQRRGGNVPLRIVRYMAGYADLPARPGRGRKVVSRSGDRTCADSVRRQLQPCSRCPSRRAATQFHLIAPYHRSSGAPFNNRRINSCVHCDFLHGKRGSIF